MRATFKKAERLNSKKAIAMLFNEGKSFALHPIRVVWSEIEIDTPFPVQVVVAVSKKKIKRAVDRNTIKRRIRESYRKNKHILYNILEEKHRKIALMLIYTTNEIEEYREIEKKIILSLQRLKGVYEKGT